MTTTAETDRVVRVLELRSVRGTGGGPEKTILFGAAKAAPHVHVTVCYIRDRRDETFGLDARARELGVDYVEVYERHSLDPAIVPQLVDIIRERRIDLVHAHEYKTDLVALWLARRTGVVPLATAHGWTGHSARERFVYYPVDKFLLARYPRVIAVSTDIKNELVRRGARDERVTVILNAIDPAAFRRSPARRAEMRRALALTDDAIAVGAVGRAEPQKRFDVLIDAMAPLLRSRPRVRLFIAGDGSSLPALKQQAAALQLGSQCVFLGHQRDVADLHQALDLFVQSSDYEGTPNAVLEAMAMETPIVATDAGGTRELAFDGTHALIVPCGDVSKLRAAITNVLDDPASARERAIRGRERVERDLSFDARTRQLEAIYTELVHA
jgi:glycosyltransferase involved in cell wall biosynthesis